MAVFEKFVDPQYKLFGMTYILKNHVRGTRGCYKGIDLVSGIKSIDKNILWVISQVAVTEPWSGV